MLKIIITLIISLSAFAGPKEYLFCLGQEEKQIHKKKIAGARKYLNEQIISQMIQLGNNLTINSKYLNKICDSQSPSTQIMKLLLKKSRFLLVNVEIYDKQEYSMALNKIKDLQEKSIDIFLHYLGWIQNQNQDPKCFSKYFPDINKVFYKATHTLEEEGIESLRKNLGNIDLIFKRLKQYPTGKKKC
ncbi:MAG: hypothetical protein N4A33_03890 [Bacteriovoracaceae bacterium]|jgi:molecular chaperone GrpE (heat shock protein)|nr:hypothetical protein [Bacteriovoracaceae bacterium]